MLDELREVAAQIYPPLLEEAGLVPALRELVTQLDAPVRVIAGPHAQTRFGDAEPADLLRAGRRPRRGGAERQARRDRPQARGISGGARVARLRDGGRAGGRRGVAGPGSGARRHGREWRDDGGTGAVRVALAEDGALFREGLQMLLQAAGHEVVAVRRGRRRAASSCCATTPADVADPRHPDAARARRRPGHRRAAPRGQHPDMGLLFLSHYAESHYLMRILQIGTDSIGYRLKEKVGSVEVLSDTLARIEAGEIVIEPVLAKRLVDRPRGATQGRRRDAVGARARRAAPHGRGPFERRDRRAAVRQRQGRREAHREHLRQARTCTPTRR